MNVILVPNPRGGGVPEKPSKMALRDLRARGFGDKKILFSTADDDTTVANKIKG